MDDMDESDCPFVSYLCRHAQSILSSNYEENHYFHHADKQAYKKNKKSRSHVCVFINIFLYLQRRIRYAARHNQEAFCYSAMVNLDNSLSNKNNGNAPLGLNICYTDIYCLRCERLFLFVARQSRAYHWKELK